MKTKTIYCVKQESSNDLVANTCRENYGSVENDCGLLLAMGGFSIVPVEIREVKDEQES